MDNVNVWSYFILLQSLRMGGEGLGSRENEGQKKVI